MKKTFLLSGFVLLMFHLGSLAQPTFHSTATFWFKLNFASVNATDTENAQGVKITGATRYRYIKQYDLFQVELDIQGIDPSISDFPHAKFLKDVTIIYEGKKVFLSKHELSEYEDLPVMIYSNDLSHHKTLFAYAGIRDMEFYCALPVLKDTLHPATIFPRLVYFEASEGVKVCEPPYGEVSSTLRIADDLDDSDNSPIVYVLEQQWLTNGCLPSNTVYFEGPLQLLHNRLLKIEVVRPSAQNRKYEVDLTTVYIDYNKDIPGWTMCKE